MDTTCNITMQLSQRCAPQRAPLHANASRLKRCKNDVTAAQPGPTRRQCLHNATETSFGHNAVDQGHEAVRSHHSAADVPPPAALPQHVALIMDGNSRWASCKGLPALYGHQEGVASLRAVVECCRRWGIPALTVFAFSMENWARAEAEVDFLLGLVQRVLLQELAVLRQAGVRLRFIGELGRLPASLRDAISHAELQTAENSVLHFTIALSYSGRQDITNAMQQIARQVADGSVQPADITPELISQHLCTRVIPSEWQQPDLIIRSSGEQRLSNFLSWESAYAELYFTNVLWPDFREEEFAAALRDYATRERRYGKRMERERKSQ